MEQTKRPYSLEVVEKRHITHQGKNAEYAILEIDGVLHSERIQLTFHELQTLRKDIYDCMAEMDLSKFEKNSDDYRKKQQGKVPLYSIPWLKHEMDYLLNNEHYERAAGLKTLILFLRKLEKTGIDTTAEICSYPSRLSMV